MAKDSKQYVPTPANPDFPNGARAWAELDMTHPAEKMFRRVFTREEVSAEDRARALARYRAAQVWLKFFMRALDCEGYSPMLNELVDGSSDPQAKATSFMDAVRERLYIFDEPKMTIRRREDLDSVIGYGNTVSEQAKRTGRDRKTVKESVLTGLDVVSGYSRWSRDLESVQVIMSYPNKNERRKKVA